jgi:hypothetical protein
MPIRIQGSVRPAKPYLLSISGPGLLDTLASRHSFPLCTTDHYHSDPDNLIIYLPMSTSEVRKGQPQLPPDKEIIALCEQQSLAQSSYNHLAYPRDSPTLFIKYGPEKLGMKGEMRNQVFAFEMLNKLPLQDRAEIKIPEVYRVIEEDGMIYVVMEYVKGNTVDWRSADEKKKFHKIARAIELFLSFETEGQSLGPVGGGLIRHPVFKDTVAPLKYNSVDDLQNHMTKVCF